MTFAAPIKVVIRLVVWDINEETGVAVDPRRQGAGGLLRRDPADDRERHVHHQRHRARRRQPAPPLARACSSITTRARRTRRQAALQRPRHPVPRLVARLRVRPQGHPLRPHRPPPQAARDRAPARARLLDRGAAQLLLRHRDDLPRAGQEVREVGRVRAAPRPARHARHQAPGHGEVLVKKNRKFTKARDQEAARSRASSACRSRSTSSSARSPRTTSSTRRPARSSSSATRS